MITVRFGGQGFKGVAHFGQKLAAARRAGGENQSMAFILHECFHSMKLYNTTSYYSIELLQKHEVCGEDRA